MATWSWHQHPDTWTAYDPALSAQIEAHFTSGAAGGIEVQLGPARTRYFIDVDSMEQVNAATLFARRIRREPTALLQGCALWEWDGGASLGWVRYNEQASQQLELAHAARRVQTCLMVSGTGYLVDLARMEQENEKTRFRRAIRRQSIAANRAAAAAVAAPAPWPASAPARVVARPRALPAGIGAFGGQLPWALLSGALGPGGLAGRARAGGAPRARKSAPLADEGCELEGELHFTSHDGQLELARVTDWRLLLPSEYDAEADCVITCCPLGADKDDPVVRLSCGCAFNRSTVERALLNKPQCPLCHFQFAELLGAMPSGTMAVWRDEEPCEGHEEAPTFVLAYSFPSGRQGPQHPEPGKEYHGTERICFVPDTPAGRRTVRLLREAFRRGLTFKIGTSVTTGRPNAVTWAIHHKTSRCGGTNAYGYPDPTYDERCAAECAALGLIIDDVVDGASGGAGGAGRSAAEREGAGGSGGPAAARDEMEKEPAEAQPEPSKLPASSCEPASASRTTRRMGKRPRHASGSRS